MRRNGMERLFLNTNTRIQKARVGLFRNSCLGIFFEQRATITSKIFKPYNG